MSNSHVHAVFGPILDSILRSDLATANAMRAEANARDAESWRWLQDSIEQSGGASIWAKKNGVQRFAFGTPSEPDDEIDPPMTGAEHRAMQDEMRHDDDRAGIA